MAKQLGIHQIKGKVGQRSYYRTKGVVDGLSRSINQGMSARVKTGEEYANTRLNNAEFKNANAIATAAFKRVPNRSRGMVVNFAIAQMTKRALEDIKQGTGAWGVRHPYSELDALICDMLENYAKGQGGIIPYIDFQHSTMSNNGVVTTEFTITKENQTALMEMGIDGVQFIAARCLSGEIDVDGEPRLYSGGSFSPQAPIVFTGESDITSEVESQFALPADVNMSPSGYSFATSDPKHGFYLIISVLPFRNVGTKRYIMQEFCSYSCYAAGQIPE